MAGAMDTTSLIIGLLVGAALGGLLAWLAARATTAAVTAERDGLRERLSDHEVAADEDDRTAAALLPLGEGVVRVDAGQRCR